MQDLPHIQAYNKAAIPDICTQIKPDPRRVNLRGSGDLAGNYYSLFIDRVHADEIGLYIEDPVQRILRQFYLNEKGCEWKGIKKWRKIIVRN